MPVNSHTRQIIELAWSRILGLPDGSITDFTAVVMGANPDETAATRAVLAAAAAVAGTLLHACSVSDAVTFTIEPPSGISGTTRRTNDVTWPKPAHGRVMSRRPTVLHRDLRGILHLPFGLALHAISFHTLTFFIDVVAGLRAPESTSGL